MGPGHNLNNLQLLFALMKLDPDPAAALDRRSLKLAG